MYLPGQAGGLAAADLLFGKACPCGKLAESYPLRYEDVPSAGIYETGGKQAQYRETIYVGYRYYEKAKKPVEFPFGFGLSYTRFEYRDLILSKQEANIGEEISVKATIRNIGAVAGSEIVQLYVGYKSDPGYRPVKELRGFIKVFLEPNEERQISFTLDSRSFSVFDKQSKNWQVPGGDYLVQLGSSSQDTRLGKIIHFQDTQFVEPIVPDWYLSPVGPIEQKDFEQLIGHKIEPLRKAKSGNFSMNSTLHDMEESFVIKAVIKNIERSVGKSYGGVDYSNPNFKMSIESSLSCPMKNLVSLSSGQMPANVARGLVHLANHQYFKAIKSFMNKGVR
jgi:beta-glucosidase